MENSALLAVLTVLSEGQEWVPRGGTSSLPPQAAQSHAQAIFCGWVGLDRVRGLILAQDKRQAASSSKAAQIRS